MNKVILVIFVIFLVGFIVPTFAQTTPNNGIDYNVELAWQQEHLWHLGKNLTVGDSYIYRICDPDAMINYSAASYHYFTKNLEHNGSLCYTIQMDFVNLIPTDQNKISSNIWIVQAQIADDYTGNTRNSVFHVDAESFEVRSADTIHPDSIRYAKSIQNTIFSIYKYTAIEQKLLQSGVNWGEVTEYNKRGANPDMKVFEKQKWNAVTSYQYDSIQQQQQKSSLSDLDVFSVGYHIDIIDRFDFTPNDKKENDANNVTNYYLVNSHLPFPVSGLYYNPSYVIEPHKEYEFELIAYLETDSNKPPQEPTKDVVDLPITETGTIKLNLPDELIPDELIPDEVIPENIPDEIISNNIDIIPDEIDVLPDEVIPENIPDENIPDIIDVLPVDTQDNTLYVIVNLAIVLGTAGIVIWKKPSFQWNKNKKNQNITRKKITFEDKLKLEIDTES